FRLIPLTADVGTGVDFRVQVVRGDASDELREFIIKNLTDALGGHLPRQASINPFNQQSFELRPCWIVVVQARSYGHVQKRIHPEFVDLPAHQVRHARLRHAKTARGFGRRPSMIVDLFSRAIISAERSFMFSASGGVSSMASHTLAKVSLVIVSSSPCRCAGP